MGRNTYIYKELLSLGAHRAKDISQHFIAKHINGKNYSVENKEPGTGKC